MVAGAKLTSRLSALAHRESTYRGGGSPRWIKVKNRKHSAYHRARLPKKQAHGKTAFHHRRIRDCDYHSQRGCTFHLGGTTKAGVRRG
jgi:hypothetical protein